MPVDVAHYITKIMASLLAFIVLQSCTSGTSGVATVETPSEPNGPDVTTTPKTNQCVLGLGSDITVSGQIKFERVGKSTGGGLDFSKITESPIRWASVQLMCGSKIVSEMSSNDQGEYSLLVPADSSDLFLRVRAELKKENTWDFTVVDNTRSQALYVMDSSKFSSGLVNINKNLLATTGFDNSLAKPAYTSTRVAAPFAILDNVYSAMNLILSANENAVFPELKLNWSVNNSVVSGVLSKGEIASSFFGSLNDPALIKLNTNDLPQIFILGLADSDTDEFDEHVIVHEWGHYFEHYFSRSDSIGGSHGKGDYLDMRVAFGEGFGNAFSAIVIGDAVYKDSSGDFQRDGFNLDVDDNDCLTNGGSLGFYSECSVQAILYDIFDDAAEAGDAVSLGFSPMYEVLINEQKTTPALISLFSFIKPLKDKNPNAAAAIDVLTQAQNIQNITDVYGVSENGSTNNPGIVSILPIYKNISIGETINICSTAENRAFGQESNGNKLGVNRYLKINLSAGQSIKINVNRTSGLITADPDIEVFLSGEFQGNSKSSAANTDSLSLLAKDSGDYNIVVYEYNYFIDVKTPETTCFDVKVTLN